MLDGNPLLSPTQNTKKNAALYTDETDGKLEEPLIFITDRENIALEIMKQNVDNPYKVWGIYFRQMKTQQNILHHFIKKNWKIALKYALENFDVDDLCLQKDYEKIKFH